MIKVAVLSIIGALFTSCACMENSAPVEIVRYEDKYLNCYGLLHAINEAETMLEHSYSRCNHPYIFANNPFCTPMVRLDASRDQYNLVERLHYLHKLCETKGCQAHIKNKDMKKRITNGKPVMGAYVKEYYIPSTR